MGGKEVSERACRNLPHARTLCIGSRCYQSPIGSTRLDRLSRGVGDHTWGTFGSRSPRRLIVCDRGGAGLVRQQESSAPMNSFSRRKVLALGTAGAVSAASSTARAASWMAGNTPTLSRALTPAPVRPLKEAEASLTSRRVATRARSSGSRIARPSLNRPKAAEPYSWAFPDNVARKALISVSTKSRNARMRGVRCRSRCVRR